MTKSSPQAKSDEGAIAVGGLFAMWGEALEALQLAGGLLDAGATAVEHFWEETGPDLGIDAVRDDGDDKPPPAGRALVAELQPLSVRAARRRIRWSALQEVLGRYLLTEPDHLAIFEVTAAQLYRPDAEPRPLGSNKAISILRAKQ